MPVAPRSEHPPAVRPDGVRPTSAAPAAAGVEAARVRSGDGSKPTGPPGGRPPSGIDNPPRKKRRKGKIIAITAAIVLVALLAVPVGMLFWANGKLVHIPALSGAAATPGTTYLITGSDSRAGQGEEVGEGEVAGQRTDTMMLLHIPDSGTTSLISLPRDTYVANIEGHGPGKLNAAFSWGGAPLLVKTVEQITGITVDHYVEVGFGGIVDVVDAMGTVNLCVDKDSVDPMSGLNMTAGCHDADGETALAFVRARYFDPTADIGRMARQQQFVSSLSKAVLQPSVILNPGRVTKLIDASTASLAVDDNTNIVDLGKLAMSFRDATGPEGFSGTPPISNPDYRPGKLGSTVRWDEAAAPAFFASVLDGTILPSASAEAPAG